MFEPVKLEINWEQARKERERDLAETRKALRKATDPRERVDCLLAMAEWTRVQDTLQTARLIREALELARSVDYYEGWALGIAELVRYSMTSSEMEAAEQLCSEADGLFSNFPAGEKKAFLYLKMAWMAYFFGLYSLSMDWSLKGAEIAKTYELSVLYARLLDMMACVHSMMNDHTAAIENHSKALSLAEKSGNLALYASVLNNFAMTYFEASELERALELAKLSVKIGSELGMTRVIHNYYDTESEILLAMGRLEEAEMALKEALSLTRKTPMDISIAYVTRTLGKVNLTKGDYKTAAEYLQQSIEIMKHLNLRGSLSESYKLMAAVKEKQGDYFNALENYKSYYEITEQTAGKESARQQAKLKASYDIQLAQKDAEIERLKNSELLVEIEDRKHVQEVLEKLAITDMLTNITNRHHFFILAEKEVERSLRYDRPLTLLIVDIDFFKRINDSLGHIAGDQVLVAIAQTIQSSLRDLDIAGRYGGEEFCVLLPETGIKEAVKAAERLRKTIAGMVVTTDKGQASVTISVGVADLQANASEKSDHTAARELAIMLDHADQALYSAKSSGRDTVKVFHSKKGL